MTRPQNHSITRKLILSLAFALGVLSQASFAQPNANISSLKLATPEAVGLNSDDVQSLRDGIQATIDAGKIPGAVLMIANKNEVGVLTIFSSRV